MRKAAVCALLGCLLMAPAMASETQNTGEETVRRKPCSMILCRCGSADYAAVLDRLKGEYDTVLLLGGSEGATVAEHTALASPAVDAVVAVNGGGRFFLDDVTDSFRNSPQPLEESQLAGFLAFTDAVKRNEVENDMLVSQHGCAGGANFWRRMRSRY